MTPQSFIQLQRLDRSQNAWMRMINQLAKAVVPALTHALLVLSPCVHSTWRRGRSTCLVERTAGCDAGTQGPQHCRAQMLQTLEGARSAEPIP